MKQFYAIKMSDGTFFIKAHGTCGYEADWSITNRTMLFVSKDMCEVEIMRLKQQFRGFDAKPYRVTI